MKRILITGSGGFLGRNLCPILTENEYSITTLDRFGADVCCDLSKDIPLIEHSIDVVLHAAGKAHVVPKNAQEEKLFYEINLQGTINLCKALETSGLPKSFIFISTVAVYGIEFGENISEDYTLNGNTPYALSKIQAEQFLTKWCEVHSVILTILRPSLIAGPNPPGNLGAMINGIKSGKYLSIGGGKARKSVLMVQDIANLVPLIAGKGGVYNICDSTHPSFRELETIICNQLCKKGVVSIPYFVGKVIALFGDLLGGIAPINSNKLTKITKPLTFSNEKAMTELDWTPLDVIANFKIQ